MYIIRGFIWDYHDENNPQNVAPLNKKGGQAIPNKLKSGLSIDTRQA